jgi:hypothetical protein
MAMSSDDKTLYIGGSTGVYVVNAQTDSLLSTLNLGYRNSQAFSPNYSLAYALHSPYPTVADVYKHGNVSGPRAICGGRSVFSDGCGYKRLGSVC